MELINHSNILHSYRYIGEEMEALGNRLDAARAALAQARNDWARWYWQETLDRLLIQWRSLPVLRDGQAEHTLIPRWTINYDFWEDREELGYTGVEGITDKIFDNIFRTDDLDDSWRRIRDERIMKCNCQ